MTARYATAAFLTLLLILLLKILILLYFLGKSVSSCIYKALGENGVIPLVNEELPQDSDLIWTYNQKRVYYKKGSNIKIRVLPVDRYGSLILENIQKNNSGEYKGEVFNADSGQLINKTEARLCVQGMYKLVISFLCFWLSKQDQECLRIKTCCCVFQSRCLNLQSKSSV